MCKRQGPESQVGSCVGNGSKDELNSLDHLMDESLSEGMVVMINSHILKLFPDGLKILGTSLANCSIIQALVLDGITTCAWSIILERLLFNLLNVSFMNVSFWLA
jgi:hypothetical protein